MLVDVQRAPETTTCSLIAVATAFSVTGPAIWNELCVALCLMPRALETTLYSNLRTSL